MSSQMSEGSLELLHLQAEAAFDREGRIRDCVGVTIACGTDGHALWLGDGVPDGLAHALTTAFAPTAPRQGTGEPPRGMEACERLIAAAGIEVERAAGPHYLIPPDARTAPVDVEIVCSGGPGAETLRDANPGNWMAIEWDELLRGQLGPWTMVHEGGRAVSICHTPGSLSARVGECGVWTAPSYRGRGYAAATVTAWLPLVRSGERRLFYSTDADNRSSQAVARRLGLRELGWTWRLHQARPATGEAVHPRSSLFKRVAM